MTFKLRCSAFAVRRVCSWRPTGPCIYRSNACVTSFAVLECEGSRSAAHGERAGIATSGVGVRFLFSPVLDKELASLGRSRGSWHSAVSTTCGWQATSTRRVVWRRLAATPYHHITHGPRKCGAQSRVLLPTQMHQFPHDAWLPNIRIGCGVPARRILPCTGT